jgi:hypothetical protein
MKKLTLLIVLSFFTLPSFSQNSILVYINKETVTTYVTYVQTIRYNDNIVWSEFLSPFNFNRISLCDSTNAYHRSVIVINLSFKSSLFPDSILMDLYKNYDWVLSGDEISVTHTYLKKDYHFNIPQLNLFGDKQGQKTILPPYLIYEIRKIEIKL